MRTPEMIKKKRADLGYSQSELANKIRGSISTIKMWETDRVLPSESMARHIVKALGYNEEGIEEILKQLSREKRIKSLLTEIERKSKVSLDLSIEKKKSLVEKIEEKIETNKNLLEGLEEWKVEGLEDIVSFMGEGVRLYKDGDYFSALGFFLIIAVSLRPIVFRKLIGPEKLASFHIIIANIYSQIGLHYAAIAELQEAIREVPDSFSSYARLAYEYKEAASNSRNREEFLKNSIDAGKKAIELYNKRKDDRELYKDCIGAAAEAYWNLGSDEAIKFYKEYVQMDKEYIWAYLRIVRFYLRKGDPEAIRWLKKGLSCEPYLSLMEFMGDSAKQWAQFKDNKEFIRLINNLDKYRDVFGDKINPNAIRNVREAIGM